MKRALLLLLATAACEPPIEHLDLGPVDLAHVERQPTETDQDADGLDDAEELRLARDYLPFLSLDPRDACPTSGLLVRVTPGERPGEVRLRYAWIFDRTCDVISAEGGGGGFSLVVAPAVAGGVLSARAIARRDTSCQRISTCGACIGQSTCSTLGGRVAVWAGSGSHAIYADRPRTCTQITNCAATCVDAAEPVSPPIVDVGEPDHPLVRDLTTEGFITAEAGWTSPSLLHYDPWGKKPFGSVVSTQAMLSDVVADPPSCDPR